MLLKGHVFSKTLGMDTGISVLVSNDFSFDKPYKVVYLLHGVSGNNSTWTDYSMLPAYANDYNAVFVMPEVLRSFYTDMKYGYKYFSYITDELPAVCKKVFNISSERQDTIVMGGSMGGYGALKAALTYPDRYGYCCAFAPGSLFMKQWLEDFRKGTIPDDPFINDIRACFGENFEEDPDSDLLELAKKAEKHNRKTKIYITCGTKDWLRGINTKFIKDMERFDIDITYEEWEGNHNWDFFNESIKRALVFCFGGNNK